MSPERTLGHTHTECCKYQVIFHRTEEAGDLPRQQANTLVVFGQHSAEEAICHLNMCHDRDWGGLVIGLRGSPCSHFNILFPS